MNRRLRAGGIHLLVSASIAALAALLVFLVWFPSPYASIAGGLGLFALLVSVDVVLGPLLTAVVASGTKPRAELRRDIVIIAIVQLVAFGYGMYSIAAARPIYMVFEVDRFTVVRAADIDPAALERAAPAFRELPWTGPRLIAARKSTNSDEMLHSLELSFSGVDISMQPERWVDYGGMHEAVLKAAHPVKALVEKYPGAGEQVRAVARRAGVAPDALLFLPLTSRRGISTALLSAADARVVGYVPVDGFL